ncbi:MAG TPA: homoserine kinase [Candidatus Bathyarchaeia archaeon]|nr:homoserine kinase [Candidatus Bathyarchaeia archaeon]
MDADCQAFCSTANLGAGFDVFGLALRKYSDMVSVKTTTSRKIRVLPESNWSQALPRDPNQNSAGPPAKALLRMSNFKGGLEIRIRKGVPYGLGLGSSGATAAACTKCVDHLLRLDLSNDELVRAASLGEKAVSGAAHADNVAASTLGGFTIVYDSPVRAISLRPPKELVIVVATLKLPQHQGKTRFARRLIPQTLKLGEAVLNIGRASAIVSGFANKNIERIGSAMHDEIAEPYREQTIPGINQARKAALQAGAAGVAISGAGPSIIAIVDKSREDPRGVAKAMVYGFRQAKTESRSFITQPAPAARILER